MVEQLAAMDFQSTMADPDVWLWAAVKGDGETYYRYGLMYVDDILAISCNTKSKLEDIQGTFKLKNDKIEPPQFYLRAKLQEKIFNGIKCWTIQARTTWKLS
jgi:hypothetical protein